MSELTRSLAASLPELALAVGALLTVIVDSLGGPRRDGRCRAAAAVTLSVALLLALAPTPSQSAWNGMVSVDPLTQLFRILLVSASLLVVVLFSPRNSRELRGVGQGELHALILLITLSNLLLAASADLVMLYLALEMVSIASYVLVAYAKGDLLSNEASLKYMLFGAVSTGVMLYGLSLVYGLCGTTSLAGIRQALSAGEGAVAGPGLLVIALLVLAGLGFKTAAVPFHFWCPDVYQGAPTPVAAFLSVAPKAAGFAVMTRFFLWGMPAQGDAGAAAFDWPGLLMAISALTMTLGNVAALTQNNIKRLLAYSSIGHAGFIMMGLVAASETGLKGLLVYLVAYLFMNLGAFYVATLIHDAEGTFDVRDYAGLSRRAPFLTLAMSIFLLSLMGMPPLVGFMGKLYVFAAVLEKGLGAFATLAAVNVAVAAYYYFRVLRAMVIDAAEGAEAPLRLATADGALLVLLTLANVVPLLFWSRIEAWTAASAVLGASR